MSATVLVGSASATVTDGKWDCDDADLLAFAKAVTDIIAEELTPTFGDSDAYLATAVASKLDGATILVDDMGDSEVVR